MPRSKPLLFALLFLLLSALPASAAPVLGPLETGAETHFNQVNTAQVTPRDGAEDRLAPQQDPSGPEYYIVSLTTPALARYRGGVEDLAPTSIAATGARKLDLRSTASQAYLRHIDSGQSFLLGKIEGIIGREPDLLYSYRYTINAVVVWLTPQEARQISTLPEVEQVERRSWDQISTDVGPQWIGAPAIWDGSAVPGGQGTKGEGVVLGILDTGVNMDHPSFAAVTEDGYQHVNPNGAGNYQGWCDPAHPKHDPSLVCNDKLIGVHSFPDGGDAPEDDNGHGSHTAGTAGGNPIGEVGLIAPTTAITRSISGVAPRANLITYDVCNTGGSCPTTANVAAIEQAVADGVDAINRSIGMGRNPWQESVAQAFFGAAEAGIFVANSAGNSTNPTTAAATGPWMTSVAASTHNRKFTNALIDMEEGDNPPADISGAGFTSGYGPAPIVFAKGKTYASGTVDEEGQCLEPYEADSWDGEIVVCDRGAIARVAKGANVLAGGAGGFVLANMEANGEGTAADPHSLPGVHIGWADAQVLHAWLASGEDHVATIQGATLDEAAVNGDVLASFSSKGPPVMNLCCRRESLNYGTDFLDLIKPDITAPGVDVLAADNSGPDITPPEWQMISGTSMSSPHVAGSSALMVGAQPEWTPMEIKSAMMLTGSVEQTTKADGMQSADPFDIGSGRVDLTRAALAGFVLDESLATMEAADPSEGGSESSLNLASMANGHCLGSCGWTRQLKSTLDTDLEWTASIQPVYGATELPAGMNLTLDTTSFTLAARGMQEIQVTADVTAAPLDTWGFAQIVFEAAGDAAPTAHMPIAILPVNSSLADFVVIETDQTSGTETVSDQRVVEVDSLNLGVTGLVKATIDQSIRLPDDPTNNSPYDAITGTHRVLVDVPEGAKRLVAETYGSESPDLDLYVGRDVNGDGSPAGNEQVCASGSPAAIEICDILAPTPGSYWILVQNEDASGNGPDDGFSLSIGVVTDADAGNLSATAPADIGSNTPFDLDLDWDLPMLAPGEIYYGVVDVGESDTETANLGQIRVDLISTMPVVDPTEIPPTAAPTSVPPTDLPPTSEPPTTMPPTTMPPTAEPPTPETGGLCICRTVQSGLPAAVIASVVNNPASVGGYQQALDPSKPVSPRNPLRECLALSNPAVPYHPLFNGLTFKVGCP